MPTSRITDAQLLTGHVTEWEQMLLTLDERRGLTVLVADPLSGASALLAGALEQSPRTNVQVDARRCASPSDLALTIADAAIMALAPEASSWWLGSEPPSSTAGMRLARLLAEQGIDASRLRDAHGPIETQIADAFATLSLLAESPTTLAIDHVGYLLSNLSSAVARETLSALRSARQRHQTLDLLLVDHPDGPITLALSDHDHPMYRSGERLRIRRPTPTRMVEDLAITRPPVKVQVPLLQAAAELAGGAPRLTWQVISMAPGSGPPGARAAAGWEAALRTSEGSLSREWEMLRRVHPAAQAVVTAMSLGLRPHQAPLASKSIYDALHRLSGVGVVWRPAPRTWTMADQLLASYAREHAQPWAHRARAQTRSGSKT